MKLHQILFSSILFLYFTTFSFSQKYQVTKDPITDEKIITATFRDRFVYMENKGEQTKLSVVKGYMGELNIEAPIGSEFIIKLDNGEIINLATTSVSSPNSYANQGVVYTNYTFETTLNKEVLSKLAAHTPTLIRLPDMKSGDRDMIEKKYFKTINEGAKYILEN
jgi:hypothetical protein